MLSSPRPSSVSLKRFTSVVLSYVLLVTLIAPLTRSGAKAAPLRAASSGASLANQSGQQQQSSGQRSGEVLVRFRPEVTIPHWFD